MIVNARPIRLVLDTSAIVAYTNGSIHVGEPLAEIADEAGAVGLPTLCLAEASWAVGSRDRLRILLEHEATAVLPTTDNVQDFGAVQEAVGKLDLTAAMVSAISEGCCVLGSHVRIYAGVPGGPVISIPR